jgi:hypothetical protein
MDKNNFSLMDLEQSPNNDLNILDNIIEVFNEMPSLGIFNPYVLLDLLAEKKIKLLKDFLRNNTNILTFNYSKKYLNYNFYLDGERIFNLKKHLKDGSYHDIFLVNYLSKKNMILRKQKDNTKGDFFDSCSDFFIHSFLSIYYLKIIKNPDVIPLIHYIGINNRCNKFMGIMNLYTGTLFDILVDNKIKNSIKKIIIFKCLNNIAEQLIILQKKFKFNHNDLKVNNIFYQYNEDEDIKDIKFYIADFGFSRIEIVHPKTKEPVKIIGGALLNYTNDYELYSLIPSKDLYFLIHNIYAYSNSNLRSSLDFLISDLGDFQEIMTVNDNWLKLYDDKTNRSNYMPEKFLNILKTNKNIKRYLRKA